MQTTYYWYVIGKHTWYNVSNFFIVLGDYIVAVYLGVCGGETS